MTDAHSISSASEPVDSVGVVGAGQMGAGIAQVFALYGFQVQLFDSQPGAVKNALETIANSLSKFVAKGTLTEAVKKEALARLKGALTLEDFSNADVVVEAIVEKESAKMDLFKCLDTILKPSCVLASNTSSISITRLAASTHRPDRVIGFHFMNPVPLMRLVEIIRGAQTSDQTFNTIHNLALTLDKSPVTSRDFPGFISNRVLMPLINEAIFTLYEGVGSAEDIDTVFKLGMNHPMGPLTLADFIGLDTVLHILNVLHDGFKDPRFRPCPLLVQYVNAGYLGRKSGRGFYVYTGT